MAFDLRRFLDDTVHVLNPLNTRVNGNNRQGPVRQPLRPATTAPIQQLPGGINNLVQGVSRGVGDTINSAQKAITAYNPTPQKITNDIGNFLLQDTPKLVNTGFGVIEKAGVNLAGETQKLLGDQAGGDRTIQQGEQSINKRLLQPGKGFLGAGGLYNSTQELHNAAPEDVINRAGGAGIQTAANFIPVGRGIKSLSETAPVVNKIVSNVTTGLVSGGVGSAGSQLLQNGNIDPLETLKGAAIGGITGGGITALGAGLKAGSQGFRKVNNEIKSQPGYNSESGFNLIPGRSKPDMPTVGNNLDSLQFNSDDYVKQQTAAQEIARRGAEQTVGTKLRDEISTKLIDSFSPIERRLREANSNDAEINITDANHITPQIDRAIRADTIAGQYIKDQGLAKIIQDVPDTKEFDQYLIANHANDLSSNGIKTGRDSAKDTLLVEQLSPQYEQYAQQIKQYSNNLLDKTVEYGLVSKELADDLKAKYPNYVPANRIFNEDELNILKGNGAGKVSIGTQTVVQRIKGSDRQIESPLASLAAKTEDVIKQGEHNKAAAILASYKDLPGNPFGLRELKTTEKVGSKSTISFIDNGIVRQFETTPEIATAAKSLNKEQMGLLAKMVSISTRTLILGATGINPAFALANITKDMVSAAINSEHPLRTSVLNPSVLRDASKAAFSHNSPQYGELVREGAGGTSFDIARDAPTNTVDRIRSKRSAGSNILYTVRHPGELLRAVEDTIGRSEEFVRALQYFGNKKVALDKNLSNDKAVRYGANAARNNSVNFARAGDYGAVLNAALPYLNAGIQGARIFNRTIRDRPAQTITKIAALGVLPVLTATSWNLADPKRQQAYNDISDYEKDTNIIIVPEYPIKDPETGKWNVIKIPISQEVASIGTIARQGLETANNAGEISIGKVLGELIGATTSIDVSSGREIANKVIPQALKPTIETLTNQNLFTGNNIIPESQKNLPANEQFNEYTSGTAKVLGNLTGNSPRVIDNAIKTATGGAGQNALNFSDNLLAMFGAINPNEVKGKSITDSVTGRFFGASSKPIDDTIDKKFNEARDSLTKTEAYKSLPQEDKARALNRLQTDIKAIEYNKAAQKPGSKYEAKDLTSKQSALDEGSRSITDYSDLSTKDKPKSRAEKHAANQKKYLEDKAAGKLNEVEDLQTKKVLAKEAITSKYSDEVNDFYSLSRQDRDTFFKLNREKAEQLYGQAKQLESQLIEKGYVKDSKFKQKAASTGKRATKQVARKGTGKGVKKSYNYAKRLVSVKAQKPTALRNLLKSSKIKAEKIKV